MAERRAAVTAAILIAIGACSSLPQDPTGVVQLQVSVPDSLALTPGDSLTLHAVALNIEGDSVAGADLRWRTPDTALIVLDSLRGIIVAKSDTGSARVQASVGTLLSNIIIIPLRSDTTGTTGNIVRSTP